MPITSSSFFKDRNDWLTDMIGSLQSQVSDAYIGEDGVIYILFAVEAGQLEQMSMANQILLQECFPQTASSAALRLYGEMYRVPIMLGLPATGTLRFTTTDGVLIPAGTQVGAPRSFGLDPIIFTTNADVTAPSPGVPTAPTAVLNATAGNLNGSYEYAVTFVTASGETLQGPDSAAVAVVNQRIDLSLIPIGGTGTTQRKIYRQKNGVGNYQLVTTINDNTTTTYTDNIADGSLGANAPASDTAHYVNVTATAIEAGANGNVAAGAIQILVNVPNGVLAVTNTAQFTNGSDDEDIEAYRMRLMERIGDPQTGSVSDLKSWAESIEGVEMATVFENDNMGTPTNGHVTVRIAGPGSSVPSASVISAVQTLLDEQDVANIVIHVTTFTPKLQNVTADVTPDATHTLADVTPEVQQAVVDFIDAIPVGGTLYVSGLVDAIYGLSGILDVVITSPSSNQTSLATEKFTANTVTVT